jgi:hypothetical protein
MFSSLPVRSQAFFRAVAQSDHSFKDRAPLIIAACYFVPTLVIARQRLCGAIRSHCVAKSKISVAFSKALKAAASLSSRHSRREAALINLLKEYDASLKA